VFVGRCNAAVAMDLIHSYNLMSLFATVDQPLLVFGWADVQKNPYFFVDSVSHYRAS